MPVDFAARVESLKGERVIAVHPSCISKAVGHKKSNYNFYLEQGIDLKFVGDILVPKYKCRVDK